MTICPLNYLDDFTVDDQNYSIKTDLTGQVCPSLFPVYGNERQAKYMENISYDIEAWAQKLKPFIYETFLYCNDNEEKPNCLYVLSESFTSIGLCYTVNGLAFKELYRDNV